MLKFLRYSLVFLPFLFSCNGETEPLPAYIHIEKIDFNYQNIGLVGNGGTAITDAWVYDNGNLLGVFELPATIPVLNKGETQINVRAGVKLNGIGATREFYRYFDQWDRTIELKDLDTVTISPSTQYNPDFMDLSFNEDFQNVVLTLDSVPSSDVPLERVAVVNEPFYLDGFVGKVTMTASKPNFKAANTSFFMVPTGISAPIYLEMDYRCNQRFVVSTIVQDPTTGTIETPYITLVSTNNEWKHIYIDLTDSFSGRVTATGFGFTIAATYEATAGEGIIYLDNVKVVTAKQ